MLTSVFEELGIPLQKRVGSKGSDEIGSSILVECGSTVTTGSSAGSEQGPKTPFDSVPGSASTSSTHTIDNLVQDQNLLKREISEVKQALAEEKALNAKRQKDLLTAISALMAKLTSPSSSS